MAIPERIVTAWTKLVHDNAVELLETMEQTWKWSEEKRWSRRVRHDERLRTSCEDFIATPAGSDIALRERWPAAAADARGDVDVPLGPLFFWRSKREAERHTEVAWNKLKAISGRQSWRRLLATVDMKRSARSDTKLK